jgi:DNA-binding NarL/FixJ family response regulator
MDFVETPAAMSVALIDDHPPILRAVIDELTKTLGVDSTFTARHVAEVLATDGPYDVIILDLQLGDGSEPGDNVRLLVSRGWPVLLYTQETNARVVARCFRAGASGIVGKGQELDDLTDALRTIATGEPYLSSDWAAALASEAETIPNLTPREGEALRLYASGLPLKSVARRMNIAQDTAKKHLMRIRLRYAEVGRPAPTKTDLYRRAVEDGLIPPPASSS